MQSVRGYVAIGLILGGVIIALAASQGFEWLWVMQAWDNTLPFGIRAIRLSSLLGTVIGITGASYGWFNTRTNALLCEVAEELRKVTWPTRQETMAATMVVLVAVFIFGAYLGVFDALFLWLTNLLLDIPGDQVA